MGLIEAVFAGVVLVSLAAFGLGLILRPAQFGELVFNWFASWRLRRYPQRDSNRRIEAFFFRCAGAALMMAAAAMAIWTVTLIA